MYQSRAWRLSQITMSYWNYSGNIAVTVSCMTSRPSFLLFPPNLFQKQQKFLSGKVFQWGKNLKPGLVILHSNERRCQFPRFKLDTSMLSSGYMSQGPQPRLLCLLEATGTGWTWLLRTSRTFITYVVLKGQTFHLLWTGLAVLWDCFAWLLFEHESANLVSETVSVCFIALSRIIVLIKGRKRANIISRTHYTWTLIALRHGFEIHSSLAQTPGNFHYLQAHFGCRVAFLNLARDQPWMKDRTTLDTSTLSSPRQVSFLLFCWL